MTAAYRIDGRLVDAERFYKAACDPRRSIVVEACAGAGKTWMLVSRILRALLDGAQPHEILALTFTRKAAGEMRERLDQWLHAFAAELPLDAQRQPVLVRELVERGLDPTAAAEAAPRLAGLHAALLQSGRGVAVRSFHGWFSQLLAAAPLEVVQQLGLPPQPELIEDTYSLRNALFERFHAAVDADPALVVAYLELVACRRRAGAQALLETAWRRRVEIERADAAGHYEGAVPAPADVWADCEGLDDPRERLREDPWPERLAKLAGRLAQHRNATPRKAAAGLLEGLACDDVEGAHVAIRKALLTNDGTPRKYLGDDPDLGPLCDELIRLDEQIAQHEAYIVHRLSLPLVRTLLPQYAALKRSRGLADMDDLDAAALLLLGDPVHSGAVLSRLDTRIRHLLVDEFQDTGPLQWQALSSWLSGYAGAGGGASGQRPLAVFIVGDPKQSVYRFRRAEPKVFAAAREFVTEALDGAVLECDHTRRCGEAVLTLANAVFAQAAAEGSWSEFRAHTTASTGAGQVWRLRDPPPDEADSEARSGPRWRDTLVEPRFDIVEQRHAAEAQRVVQAVTHLLATGRRPGEIMVLARRRRSLRLLAQALAAAGVAYVMPEPIEVQAEPEAQDLLAVLDVLASPTQDLALARALRSPLFGATDVELLQLAMAVQAAGRPACWWTVLLDRTRAWPTALERARKLLQGWSEIADWLPPHDLLDRVVHEGDFIARLAAAVPPARREVALQVVAALLRASLELDQGRYASPYGFVRALRSRAVPVKVASGTDAVALLTIHGAKGLEAEVVFIVDADPADTARAEAGVLVDWPVDQGAPARAALLPNLLRAPPSLQSLAAAELAAQSREEINALYVAMTRARSMLVFSRTPMKRTATTPTWWRRIEERVEPWDPSPAEGAATAARAPGAIEVPWDRPCAIPDAASTTPATRATRNEVVDPAAAALGRALHRLLEWLMPTQTRPQPWTEAALKGAASAAARWAGLPPAQAATLAEQARAIFESPQAAPFFGPASWAGNEVPVTIDAGSGRIDRLVAFDLPDGGRHWWVLDYKLARDPARDPEYRAQLAAYAGALRRLQPADRVSAAFIAAGGRVEIIDT